jgi:3-deoxy-manno-octulosonate cytidylyltransferase (CMP-KDO synthetase)
MKTLKIIALIPARMGSTRFPGKPLALIAGKPMIQHVYENTNRSEVLESTVVATCDKEIFDFVESIGGKAVMTGSQHERASDRCAEALEILERESGETYDLVVMVQGDEPLVHPDMISEAVGPFYGNPDVLVSNLIGAILSEKDYHDRNVIKVACDLHGKALYFSRMPIPTDNLGNGVNAGKQVCVIPFRRDFLLQYLALDPTPHEIAESVDMMRVLEHGFDVTMVPTKHESFPVDTAADLERVEKIVLQKESN